MGITGQKNNNSHLCSKSGYCFIENPTRKLAPAHQSAQHRDRRPAYTQQTDHLNWHPVRRPLQPA